MQRQQQSQGPSLQSMLQNLKFSWFRVSENHKTTSTKEVIRNPSFLVVSRLSFTAKVYTVGYGFKNLITTAESLTLL